MVILPLNQDFIPWRGLMPWAGGFGPCLGFMWVGDGEEGFGRVSVQRAMLQSNGRLLGPGELCMACRRGSLGHAIRFGCTGNGLGDLYPDMT